MQQSTIRINEQGWRLPVFGYEMLDSLHRHRRAEVVRVRIGGRRAVAITGPESEEVLYGAALQRAGAVPRRVRRTLFGEHAVQSLDGHAHRRRKALFMQITDEEQIDRLLLELELAWQRAMDQFDESGRLEVMRDVGRVLCDAAWRWSGVPLHDDDVAPLTDDLISLVDGFGGVGPRHWRGRRARIRCNRRARTVIELVRCDDLASPPGSPVVRIAAHREDGQLLGSTVAGVELLNVLRPIVAIAYFAATAAEQLAADPDLAREISVDGDLSERFAHEVRRTTPLTPFLGARASRDQTAAGCPISEGDLVLVDVWGPLQDERYWERPHEFDPNRFDVGVPAGFPMMPQGGGDPWTGHRCAGEQLTVKVLSRLSQLMAGLDPRTEGPEPRRSMRRLPARHQPDLAVRLSSPGRPGHERR